MLEVKPCTDVEQSKKLAEFLLPETADFHYVHKTIDFEGNPVDGKFSDPRFGNTLSKKANYIIQNFEKYELVPCWSLAALRRLLPYKISYLGESLRLEESRYEDPHDKDNILFSISYDGLFYHGEKQEVDAVYELIMNLHSKNIL